MELSLRKREILKEVIDAFIATGEPVGSKAVMQKLKTPCSSATIRNEMASLEEMGLLEQPHTSAGRIPTGRGYRLYVDSLMENCRLTFEETLLFNSLLSDKYREAQLVLPDIASLLAGMTGYTVVAFAKERCGTVERFEGVYINSRNFLLVVITSTGVAVTKRLKLEIPTDPEGVETIVNVLNEYLAKKELGGVTLERLLAMEKELGSYRGIAAPLVQIIYEIIEEMGKENVTVKGLSNLFNHDEFCQREDSAALLSELEDQKLLLDRFAFDAVSGMRVHIGTNGKGLDRASYVTCPFRMGKNLTGTVCIIGPKRMNYAQAMAKLEYLAKQINAVHGFESNLPLLETKET